MSEEKLSTGFKIKRSVVSTSLLALGAAFEMVSQSSPEMQAELADWDEGMSFSMGVLNDGPAITMKKEGGVLKFVGKGLRNPSISIFFKNIDSAVLALTGQIGAHTAFIQQRAILHGGIHQAMKANRVLDMVQAYLLPGFVLNKVAKKPLNLTGAQLMLKLKVMALLAIKMIAISGR